MNQIHSCAELTIIAAVEREHDTGLPGVAGRPRKQPYWRRPWTIRHPDRKILRTFLDVVGGSSWNKRGWTFKEGALSRRAIAITAYRWYFICNEGLFEEDFGWTINFARERDINDAIPSHLVDSWTVYQDAVKRYVDRKFTFESDILRAFTGFSNQAAAQLRTRILCGLPENRFLEAICWKYVELRRRRYDAKGVPSWSWAAWEGSELKFPGRHGWSILPTQSVGSIVQFFDANLNELKVQDKWFTARVGKTHTEEPYPIPSDVRLRGYHEAGDTWPIGAAAEWATCPHNGSYLGLPPSFDSRRLLAARETPDPLIFNSTVAHVSFKVIQHQGRFSDCTNDTLTKETATEVLILDRNGKSGRHAGKRRRRGFGVHDRHH